jgi:uncharacterized protein (TIGR02452 family)
MSGRLGEIARQSVAIAEAGEYRNSAGDLVTFAAAVRAAVAGARLYSPGEAVAITGPPVPAPVFEVTHETTLAAARRVDGDPAWSSRRPRTRGRLPG